MSSKLANLSPRHIVINHLRAVFGDIVWERLPEPDSDVTNQEYAFVVTEVSESTTVRNCEIDQRRMLIDVTIYERSDCGEPGTLQALDRVISDEITKVEGDYKYLTISRIYRQSSAVLPYIDDKFRARTVTFSIDYGV